MAERRIVVTDVDLERLTSLLATLGRTGDRENLERFEAELDRALVVPPPEIPPDVVTMNSEVAVRDLDSSEEMVFTVVFPSEADVDRQRVSVLAPVGMAVLGYRVGDTIEWSVPKGIRRLQIERVLYQPEAASVSEG